MRVRRVALFEFMPYGAPELIECSPVHLARAVFLGALGWSVAFVILVASGVLRLPPAAPPLIRIPPEVHLVPPLLAPPDKAPEVASRRVPPEARPIPVRDLPDEPVVPPIEPGYDEGRATGEDLQPGNPPGQTGEREVGVIPEARPPYEWHEVDQLPEVLHGPRPDYPAFAREAQVDGLVMVRVLVGRDGRVERAEIERSIPLLDQAALETARLWTFDPARVAGRPVAVWIAIPFRFRLH